MPMLINDHELEEELIAERRASGHDRLDEVWDGVYVMAPIANNLHQKIQTRLASCLDGIVESRKLGLVLAGANVSDRETDWTQNYRVPDVLVFLNGNNAQDRDTHWFGGPDFAVEIVSPYDRSREKIDFYSSVGVRELLLIDRNPWQIELFHAIDGKLTSTAIATVANGLRIQSQVVPIVLSLAAGEKRPTIAISSTLDGQAWII